MEDLRRQGVECSLGGLAVLDTQFCDGTILRGAAKASKALPFRRRLIHPNSVVTPWRFGSPNRGGEGRIDWVGCYDPGVASFPPQ